MTRGTKVRKSLTHTSTQTNATTSSCQEVGGVVGGGLPLRPFDGLPDGSALCQPLCKHILKAPVFFLIFFFVFVLFRQSPGIILSRQHSHTHTHLLANLLFRLLKRYACNIKSSLATSFIYYRGKETVFGLALAEADTITSPAGVGPTDSLTLSLSDSDSSTNTVWHL